MHVVVSKYLPVHVLPWEVSVSRAAACWLKHTCARESQGNVPGGPDAASLQLPRCPRGPASSNPSALQVWEQEKLLVLLPKHPPSLSTPCRNARQQEASTTFNEKRVPEKCGMPLDQSIVFLVGSRGAGLQLRRESPTQSSTVGFRHWLISGTESCRACWEAAADGVGVPGTVKNQHFGEMSEYLTNTVWVTGLFLYRNFLSDNSQGGSWEQHWLCQSTDKAMPWCPPCNPQPKPFHRIIQKQQECKISVWIWYLSLVTPIKESPLTSRIWSPGCRRPRKEN